MDRFKEFGAGNNGPVYWSRQWNVSKDHVLPKPFIYQSCIATAGSSYSRSGEYGFGAWGLPLTDNLKFLVETNARAAAAEQVADAPNLLLNIAEKQQTIDLATSSIISLAALCEQLRRGDMAAIRATWNSKKKFLPDTWLKIHFGVEPTVKDAYAAASLMSQPLKTHYINVTKGGKESGAVLGGSAKRRWETSYSVRVRGAVAISNPNLFLASRLGLINPAVIAWERVPFSFVVDWFSTFGSVLASWTDFVGLDTSLVSSTLRTKCNMKEWIDYGIGPGGYYDGPSYEKFKLERQPGVPPAHVVGRRVDRLSLTRGTTAVALLLQQLNKA